MDIMEFWGLDSTIQVYKYHQFGISMHQTDDEVSQ